MLVGQQFGPFTIDKELGSGAMGTVYRGRYTKTGQVMAIKVMSAGIGSTNAAAADRFEREITILKQLKHANIVRFYGAGKQQGCRYFAMEYIEGESLDKVMARRGRMTWEEVVALGQQLCAALQHAHEQGIIHRDLKPSNIMVLSDGTLKLTDFGIAKDTDLEGLTQTNCTVGTASYMSPEQCKGERNLTNRSDLYSLGVLFYELLTGRKPFEADNAMEMFMQHVQGPFERPSRLVFDIPVWLDTLVCQLMEKKPEQRPLDAHMVANTLGTIQEKVEAQQSAGVDAVRRRLIDRTSGQKRPDEEDKDAARTLLTGKGKSKRKKPKKQWYEQVWMQAVGLLLMLAVAGTLLYLVFRPPSADRLYEQAKKLMESGQAADQQKAAAPDGPITLYLKHYRGRSDAQARQVQEWADHLRIAEKEELLDKYIQKQRSKALLKVQADNPTEEQAFAAVKAEEDGDRPKASEIWQQLKQQQETAAWGLVAAKHLGELGALDKLDRDFQTVYQRIHDFGEEQPLPDARQQQAFHAWRAENFGDRRLAQSLFQAFKEETTEDAKLRGWRLYAACKAKDLGKQLDEAPQDKKDIEPLIQKRLDEAKPRRGVDALPTYLDILALYAKDEAFKSLVDQARKLRDAIYTKQGRSIPS
jgi:serine/threonine-protein kinase